LEDRTTSSATIGGRRSPAPSGPERAPHVEALFDVPVVAFQLAGPGAPGALAGAEAAAVARAGSRRLAQFAAGRQCAHAALGRLGVAPAPLLPSPDRAPRWPAGTIGSITHTGDHALAVVARAAGPVSPAAERGTGIGVDAERIGRLTPDLCGVVLSPEERAWLDQLPDLRRAELTTVGFSAKEAFYKAQHPWTGRWVGFGDVAVRPAGDAVELVAATGSPALDGWRWPVPVRWLADGDLVVAAVTLQPLLGARSTAGARR
jgi:4'-phosphopantetheinyl transferase EntD